jgi:hypothetical protein
MFIQSGGVSNTHSHSTAADATGANARHSHGLGASGSGISLGATGGNNTMSLMQPWGTAYMLIKL